MPGFPCWGWDWTQFLISLRPDHSCDFVQTEEALLKICLYLFTPDLIHNSCANCYTQKIKFFYFLKNADLHFVSRMGMKTGNLEKKGFQSCLSGRKGQTQPFWAGWDWHAEWMILCGQLNVLDSSEHRHCDWIWRRNYLLVLWLHNKHILEIKWTWIEWMKWQKYSTEITDRKPTVSMIFT